MKKNLFVLLLASLFLIFPIRSFGFEHKQQMPSTIATEQWEFSKNEIRDILIEYLESKGYEIRNKKSGRITIRENVFPNKIITLWIKYDISPDTTMIGR